MPKWIFVNVVILFILFAGALCGHESGSAKYVVEAYRLEPGVPAPEDRRKTRRSRVAKGKACKRVHSTRARSSQTCHR